MALFSTLLTLIVVEQLYEALKRFLHSVVYYKIKITRVESKWQPVWDKIKIPSKELKIAH